MCDVKSNGVLPDIIWPIAYTSRTSSCSIYYISHASGHTIFLLGRDIPSSSWADHQGVILGVSKQDGRLSMFM